MKNTAPDDTQKHTSDTVVSDENVKFSDLGLPVPILKALEETGYETPSAIQQAAIPPLLEGRDLIGQAQTGTGKTAAFAAPALSRLDLAANEPQLLVLTPTRELAIQVAEAMQTYARHLKGFRILPVYGGQGMDTQLRQLRRGVHAVVGTPGRIQDHIQRNTLKLQTIKIVVLDEADEMLRMGFVEEVEAILAHTPAQKQVALFSATMPNPIRKIAKNHLNDPIEIKIKAKSATVSTVRQRYCQATAHHKLDALTRILEVENFDGMVIFVRTKTATVELAEKLEARGFSSSPINGDMNQALRERTVARLKQGSLDILVATDVAARGLDVERISHVVNYDIPHDTESYIHRIGRTARAGRSGEAILFVAPREKRMLGLIEKATGKKIEPMSLPSEEEIADRRIASFHALISETIASEDLTPFQAVVSTYQQNHSSDLTEIAAALAYLSQKERPLIPDLPPLPQPSKRNERQSTSKREKSSEKKRFDTDKGERSDARSVEAGMVRYRIAVGCEHKAEPKHIVGAIANEAGLSNQDIGRIDIFDDHSLVDLPDGMPKDIFQHLRKVRICGHKMRIVKEGQWEKDGGDTAENPDQRPAKGQAKTNTTHKPKSDDKARPKNRKPKKQRRKD